MYGQGVDQMVEVDSTTVLGLPQDADLSLEIPDLFVLRLTIRVEIGLVNVENLDGDHFLGGNLAARTVRQQASTTCRIRDMLTRTGSLPFVHPAKAALADQLVKGEIRLGLLGSLALVHHSALLGLCETDRLATVCSHYRGRVGMKTVHSEGLPSASSLSEGGRCLRIVRVRDEWGCVGR